MSGQKGTRIEREFVQLLRDLGFTIIRAPASGAANKDDLPDVLAGNGRDCILAVELKAWKGHRAEYFEEAEVASLVSFARGFHPDTVPLLGTRWNQDTNFYVKHAMDERLHRTDSGNVRAKKEVCQEEWHTLEDFLVARPSGDATPEAV